MSSLPTAAPSFTSFPDTPGFDSLPAQDGKKRTRVRSRSRSDRRDDDERTRRKDKRRGSPHDAREHATSSRKHQRAIETPHIDSRASDSGDRTTSNRRRSRHHGSHRGDGPKDSADRQSRSDTLFGQQTSERKLRGERKDEKRRRPSPTSPNVRNDTFEDEVCQSGQAQLDM